METMLYDGRRWVSLVNHEAEVGRLQARIDALEGGRALPEGWCTVGVGDGWGELFVHGPHDAVKRVQALVLELEEGRAWGERNAVIESACLDATGRVWVHRHPMAEQPAWLQECEWYRRHTAEEAMYRLRGMEAEARELGRPYPGPAPLKPTAHRRFTRRDRQLVIGAWITVLVLAVLGVLAGMGVV